MAGKSTVFDNGGYVGRKATFGEVLGAAGPPTYVGLVANFANTTSATYTATFPSTAIFVSVNSVNATSLVVSIDGVAMTAIGTRYNTNIYNSSFGWFYGAIGLAPGSKSITIAHNGQSCYGCAVAYRNINTLGSPFYTASSTGTFTVPGSTLGKIVIGCLNTNDTTSGFAGGTQRERQTGQTIFEATGVAGTLTFTASCDGGSGAMGWAAAAVS